MSRIELPLGKHLERSSPEELVPVALLLERQVTEEEKRRLFSQIDTQDKLQAKQQQRALLIQALKHVATAEQSELLKLLKVWEKGGQVRNVRSLWLTNVIGLEARPSAIEQLATFQGIRSIHLDLPRPVMGAVAWGVTKIQADQVWNMRPRGHDGTGVVVAVMDSGVSYQHLDLIRRMWINSREDKNHDNRFTAEDDDRVDNDRNGYIDDVVGWNFEDRDNDPNDSGMHGTHVAGIVSGDGAQGLQTGVAPGARIMALRVSDTQNRAKEQMCWEGMQYALEEGADIVNFSDGWKDAWFPEYKHWRLAVKNLMDAGVLFVTITFNNDANAFLKIPFVVRTPGRVPDALTVGATDKADQIAAFSNRGPVTWQSVEPFHDYPWPPGLRKPDVTAPGMDIDSTIPPQDYGHLRGTSMAAPHVAGLAALLLDKDPSLTPYELKFIIEETSVALGARPDSVFGWGRIDAPAAINYRISPLPYDLATDRNGRDIWVDNNDDGTPDKPVPRPDNHLYARIRNLGGRVVNDAEVRFYSFGAGRAGCGGGPRTLLGSYIVPILGPASSRHGTALAVIHWKFQAGDPRCIGVEIAAPPPNQHEPNLSNNTGFREL